MRLCLLALLLGVSASTLALDVPAIERGWRPVLTLAAGGHDRVRAVNQLRRWMDVSGKAIHEVRMDARTEAFVEQMWTSIEDFDLSDLYAQLPEAGSDRWRRLPILGEPRGDHYFVGRPRAGASFEVRAGGKRKALAAGSFLFRMKPVPNRTDPDDDDPNYLIHLRTGLVVGEVPFEQAARAQTELLSLLGGERPPGPSQRALALARKHHPRLGSEDAPLMATLFEAFPFGSSIAADFIEVEDIVDAPAADGARRLRIHGRLAPERFDARYPELASHVRNVSRLLKLKLRWVDERGRTLARLALDTEKLHLRIELHVKDGLLVPTRGERVFVEAALDPLEGRERRTRLLASSTIRAMGVTTVARDVVIDLRYRGRTERGRLEARMTRVPKVTVGGAVLGFIPTALVDAVIPGDLKQLIDEFLTTATTGNGGRGIRVALEVGRKGSTGPATVEGQLELEALDNALVAMGVRLALDRIIFDDDATAEAEHLAARIHEALVRDLERYAIRARLGSAQ
ncbi:MAG: hypothetical protein OXT09_07875 [Myxococcales bacterium]|nr:hypothetical protein [Myxococcales bacterium]